MPRAPKHCGRNGCTTRVHPPNKHCPEHTGWNTSPRTASADHTNRHHWKAVIRPAALHRDHNRCQIRTPGICIGLDAPLPDAQLDVDHIVPVSEGGPDTLDNARTACRPCHRHRTAIDAAHTRHHGGTTTAPPRPPEPPPEPPDFRPPIVQGVY